MLIGHPVPGKRKAEELVEAFIAGAPRDAEGHVFYGVKDSNLDAWRKVRASGQTFYFIDGSYFDEVRDEQFRITRNAIQWVWPKESNGARFRRLGIKVRPALDRPDDWPALAVEQSEVFMRIIAQAPTWLDDAVRGAASPVRVRRWTSDKPEAIRQIASEIEWCKQVITHSSAAAVRAVLTGVPVHVSRMSACWSMSHGLPDVETRTRWASALADNQFTRAEMRNGFAWRSIHG